MKIALVSALAFGACAAAAFAEPLPPAGDAEGKATAEARAAGPVALTEDEMDKVSAGYQTKLSYQPTSSQRIDGAAMQVYIQYRHYE